ncbi:adenine deaminase [Bacillus chungangensis]|uniref:Adenine deaminase n=1 Tax=Bacillus chungangensis TaxID=587633 RepID=A0ABT9WNQ0_9BACI|nr:adenine deaminase [Bacillus chungangensis]MDQ0174909.1 adenine deaminase [Bacillus chungangensis]
MSHRMRNLIDTAQHISEADIVLKNGTIVDVFSLETYQADVAIHNGYIIGIGNYEQGSNCVDVSGKYIIPGLIDGHIHIESTMVTPSEFSRALFRHGITTVVTDPHEIANVAGIEGIKYVIEDANSSLIDILFKLPSCVPATSFERNGATLTADDLYPLLSNEKVIGLAEVMDFHAVLTMQEDMLNKLKMVKDRGMVIDGHAAGLSEQDLNIYSIASIRNDHEAVTKDEAIDRVRRGFHVLVREGSAAKDLLALLPAISPQNSTRFSFCTDDKHLDELVEEGTINYAMRLAIKHGLDPLIAIQMATINNAICHQIENKGAVAPGYVADLLLVDDLVELHPSHVIKDGRIFDLGSNKAELKKEKAAIPMSIQESINMKPISKEALQIIIADGQLANVIEIIPNQLITKKSIEKVLTKNGLFQANVADDQIKIAVCERHHATGGVGLGIVKGLKLNKGAIASTVAHDSHNLVVAGTNDDDMILAIEAIRSMQGGLVIVSDGEVLAKVPLKIGGIMSEKPYEKVVEELHHLHEQLRQVISGGEAVQNVFMILSFLCLPVIPSLKLTDKGLFDVDSFQHIEVGIK